MSITCEKTVLPVFMPQVIRTRDILGKLQMRHILFHVLLARYQDLVQLNIHFYRTGMSLNYS